MLKLRFGDDTRCLRSVLFLGAHCDDIEIGCGGVVQRLVKEYPNVDYHWIVFSSNDKRRIEAAQSANAFLGSIKNKHISINEFKNGFFPYIGAEIKEYFEKIKMQISPDLIFTHYRKDLHQDHRLISDLTWNTFRDHLILEYEIAKYDGDIGCPNFFVQLDEEQCQYKVKNILQYFESQKNKQWFSENTFYSLMRIRGIESNSPSGYAEGFYSRKISI